MNGAQPSPTANAASSAPIGLIAGQGMLPIIVAQGMRASGRRVVGIGLANQYSPEFPALCDDFAEAGIVQLGRWIRLAKRFGAHEAVMVGRVSKARMHEPFKWFRQMPDLRALDIWYRRLRHDRRSATLLTVLADELSKRGLALIDSTHFIPDHLATEGLMTRRAPNAQQESDIAFAWPLLRSLGALDIGQAMAVRDKDVIAVEAVEGTDRMIARAGELCRARGWTLLKSARAGHDMRADVPTIGVSTIEAMHAAGGACIAVGVGRVILVDRPAVLAAGDRLGVAIVGMRDE